WRHRGDGAHLARNRFTHDDGNRARCAGRAEPNDRGRGFEEDEDNRRPDRILAETLRRSPSGRLNAAKDTRVGHNSGHRPEFMSLRYRCVRKVGYFLAQFLEHFGLGAVRGSTSRRASVALREMARRVAEGHDIIITPDGPRGPRYHVQSGALYLAQRTSRPIIPLHLEYSRYLRFKSWDGFAIALPFARVKVVIGEP